MNTHSLIEDNYSQKLDIFINAMLCEKPDIIALQEVNQSINGSIVSKDNLMGFYPCQDDTIIREDNHVYNVAKRLRELGLFYYWTWLPLKIGYQTYDEGLAILSANPIIETDTLLISNANDYQNWRTRKILGIRTKGNTNEWFYSVHMSWWNDLDEPFQSQWKRLQEHLKTKEKVWLMGDFNNPAEVLNEGYTMIENSNWLDTYSLAKQKDIGFTIDKLIDGWKEKLPKATGMRIDQIWCNKRVSVKSSKVIFNGRNYPIVSDHYGVIISID